MSFLWSKHPLLWKETAEIVAIVFGLLAGLFLAMAPWDTRVPFLSTLWQGIWENNYFSLRYAGVAAVMANPFLKGAVTGLGLVNIIIALYLLAGKRRQ